MQYYKFRSCKEEYNFQSLENQSVYFAPFDSLNDPFEGKYEIGYFKNPHPEVTEESIKQRLNRRLIYSMCKGNEQFVLGNNLMWVHYADEHKGFCIEYSDKILQDFTQFKSKDLNIQTNLWMDVNYDGSRIEPITEDDDVERWIADIIRNKSGIFEYENEVRLVLHTATPEQRFKDVSGCITAVYLGCRIPLLDKLRLVYIAHKLGIKCYQTAISSSSYELEKHEIITDNCDLKMVDSRTCRLINE